MPAPETAPLSFCIRKTVMPPLPLPPDTATAVPAGFPSSRSPERSRATVRFRTRPSGIERYPKRNQPEIEHRAGFAGVEPEIEAEPAVREDPEENRQRGECRERLSLCRSCPEALHDFLLRHLRRSSE